MKKTATAFTLGKEVIATLTAYATFLCNAQGISLNLSHAVRSIIRKPENYIDWLTRHATKKKRTGKKRSKIAAH